MAQLYLGVIYIGNPEPVRHLARNDSRVISFRIKRVTLLCLTLLVVVPLLTPVTFRQLDLVVGFTETHSFCTDIFNVIYAIKILLILYLCKIIDYIACYALGNITDDIYMNFFTLNGFRDHIFAPISEEFIYRSVIINLLLNGGYSQRKIILYSPLLFGFAHIHHGYQNYKTFHQTLISSLTQVIFMTLYTTIFGILQSYLFLKLNSLPAVVCTHLICNLFGFPDLFFKGKASYQFLYFSAAFAGIAGFYYSL